MNRATEPEARRIFTENQANYDSGPPGGRFILQTDKLIAWVLIKFGGYTIVERSAPVFPDSFNKYAGIAERVLVLTVTLAGLFVPVPVLVMLRMFIERKQLENNARRPLFLFESLAGISLADIVGLLLRAI